MCFITNVKPKLFFIMKGQDSIELDKSVQWTPADHMTWFATQEIIN